MITLPLKEKKFVVVADAHSHEPLEIFFADGLPDLHSEIFAVAQKQWAAKGVETVCAGGGRFCVIENFLVFYDRSLKYHRFDSAVVEALSKKHPAFRNKGYRVISDTRYTNPLELFNQRRTR
ncbi:MAG TPA: hypothetical protein PLI16_05630 [Bacteroidales bacterium]|jgi:hypothetical protein|nr:hypothetical protein [Bacteroidales bacterium]HNZ43820.1 hypothetical protein [Bacteroidales bacterium]HOH84075.1 hypothetical protein [Bacteroidales bacterium]HPB25581.1 hypothetical protein [Bacteroidales bacterium]HPI29877.1 hypothetical protein [Bacteroidales bacterium]